MNGMNKKKPPPDDNSERETKRSREEYSSNESSSSETSSQRVNASASTAQASRVYPWPSQETSDIGNIGPIRSAVGYQTLAATLASLDARAARQSHTLELLLQQSNRPGVQPGIRTPVSGLFPALPVMPSDPRSQLLQTLLLQSQMLPQGFPAGVAGLDRNILDLLLSANSLMPPSQTQMPLMHLQSLASNSNNNVTASMLSLLLSNPPVAGTQSSDALLRIAASHPMSQQMRGPQTQLLAPMPPNPMDTTSSVCAAVAVASFRGSSSSSLSLTTSIAGRNKKHPIPLTSATDIEILSEYQRLLRDQMEYFEATVDNVRTTTQGRNNPIRLKQVGLQCKHCRHLAPQHRPRGAVYFPAKLLGIYQSAQNMGTNHFNGCCPHVDPKLHKKLQALKETKSPLVHGGGKKYWAEKAVEVGIVEVEGGGLEFAADGSAGSSEGEEAV